MMPQLLSDALWSQLCAAGYAGTREINPSPPDNWTPLTYAAGYLPELVEPLIKAGANPDLACGMDRRTPLMYAVYEISIATEVLLAASADVDLVDQHGYHALAMAVFNGNHAAVRALLKAGAKASIMMGECPDVSVLMRACTDCSSIVMELLEHGANATLVNNEGRNAFHYIASVPYSGNVDHILQGLLLGGALPNLADKKGNTPFHLACQTTNNQSDAAVWLLAHGADISQANDKGFTPLMLASASSVATVHWLLDQGADITPRNKDQQDALMLAAACPSSVFERYAHTIHRLGLIGSRATPAHRIPYFAREANPGTHPDIVESAIPALLATGADPALCASNGATALMYAARHSPEMVPVLLAAGADPNACDRSGWTPLMCATGSARGHLAIEPLLKAGADPLPVKLRHRIFSQLRHNARSHALMSSALLDLQTTRSAETPHQQDRL
jgi:ankyrin repeat protein